MFLILADFQENLERRILITVIICKVGPYDGLF